VPETIEYEEFGATGEEKTPAAIGPADLSRLSDIPMELSVELGRSHMTVGQTLELRVGAVVALERQAGEPADLLVNGSPIARGEIVVVEEQYGLRITEILDERQQTPLAGAPNTGDEQPPAAVAESAAGDEEA
jgi:flagellar motor switch protein FliN/FliY